ncbi:MAG: AraC family transcriptional regulator [Eubacteriales bacterium]|nr:AraC family transcriptional regulator [Eubacteriales bacterium]
MQKETLMEARPTIEKFHRVIGAVIQRGFAKSGPTGRKTDGFIYALEGSAHYELDGMALDVKTGDFFYLARNAVYSMTVKSETYRVIIVNFDFYRPDGNDFFCAKSPVNEEKNAEKLFRKLLSVWQLQSTTVREECLSLLYTLYAEFLTTFGMTYLSSISRNRMNDAVRYINKHLGDGLLSIPEIAESVHMSESHFRRSFKESFKLSPVQYINMQRIQQAKDLIRYSRDSFSTIAERLGFSSIYHFSHLFKKEVGYSPSEYRKRYDQYPKT